MPEARAPHEVGDIQTTAVVQPGSAAKNGRDARSELNTGAHHILTRKVDEQTAMRKHRLARLASEGSSDGQYVCRANGRVACRRPRNALLWFVHGQSLLAR